MGRTNRQWRHVIGVGIEVSAPDVSEASRRIEDARDALQARFTGSEIYPPRIAGSKSRIPGTPTLKHFLMIDRPSEVDPFDDSATLTEATLRQLLTTPELRYNRAVKVEEAATNLILILRQSMEGGWIPAEGGIGDAVDSLESALGPGE